MAKRVVITGLGCISPLGNHVAELWSNLLAGRSGAAPITHFDTGDYKTIFAAEVKNFDGGALFVCATGRPNGFCKTHGSLRYESPVAAGATTSRIASSGNS